MQAVGWSDSSRNGPRMTFARPSREHLQAFIGCEGKRFMAVLVLIGDDELPVPPPQPAPKQAEPKAPKVDHSLSKWAALRCADPEFRHWAGLYFGEAANFVDAEKTAQWMRAFCSIKSRAELDTNTAAADCFKTLVMAPWSRHCLGRGIT